MSLWSHSLLCLTARGYSRLSRIGSSMETDRGLVVVRSGGVAAGEGSFGDDANILAVDSGNGLHNFVNILKKY